MLRRKIKRRRESSEDQDDKRDNSLPKSKYSHRSAVKENEDSEYKDLEKLVFGDQGYFESLTGTNVKNDSSSFINKEISSEAKKTAWVDEDDYNLSVDITLKNQLKKFRDGGEEIITGDVLKKKLETQFKKIYGAPVWASEKKKGTKKEDDDDDEDSELLQRTGSFLSKSTDHLPKGLIDIVKVKDGNVSKPLNAVLGCIEFHPNSKILLTAGLNNTLSIFQVDGQTNSNLQTIFLKGFPIHTAHFIGNGQQVLLASKRRHFFCYDIVAGSVTRVPEIRGKEDKYFDKFSVSPDGKYLAFLGNSGYIYLLSTKTKQWVADLKMNGFVYAVSFSSDGNQMISAGSDGDVYIWDMETKKCLHRFKDEGSLITTTIALSGDGRYLACGSSSGVVNIYDNSCFTVQLPKPIKTLMNLTTRIDQIKFNGTSEILGVSSRSVKNAFRLVHLPSLSVFSNWPTTKTPLRYVESFDFSPKSGYLAIGNDRGRALLFRLNHYTDA